METVCVWDPFDTVSESCDTVPGRLKVASRVGVAAVSEASYDKDGDVEPDVDMEASDDALSVSVELPVRERVAVSSSVLEKDGECPPDVSDTDAVSDPVLSSDSDADTVIVRDAVGEAVAVAALLECVTSCDAESDSVSLREFLLSVRTSESVRRPGTETDAVNDSELDSLIERTGCVADLEDVEVNVCVTEENELTVALTEAVTILDADTEIVPESVTSSLDTVKVAVALTLRD